VLSAFFADERVPKLYGAFVQEQRRLAGSTPKIGNTGGSDGSRIGSTLEAKEQPGKALSPSTSRWSPHGRAYRTAR